MFIEGSLHARYTSPGDAEKVETLLVWGESGSIDERSGGSM